MIELILLFFSIFLLICILILIIFNIYFFSYIAHVLLHVFSVQHSHSILLRASDHDFSNIITATEGKHKP